MGLLTYALIRRSIPQNNRAPLVLLWLIMMMPASVWLIWALLFGSSQIMPLIVILPLLILSPVLYWSLLEWGKPKSERSSSEDKTTTAILPKKEPLQKQAIATPKQPLRPISSNEEKALRDCFPWGVYYLQDIDYYPQAILCRGKLRAVPKEAYHTIRDNVETLFGDRFLVVFQESFQGQPFFALVPNPWKEAVQAGKAEEPLTRPDLAVAMVLITLFSATVMGLELQGFEPEAVRQNSELLWQGLPYSLVLIGILGFHELGHYFTYCYYKVKATLPYFVPLPFFIGTLGAYTQRRSPIPHRQALFDIAVSGSWIGILLTLPALWIGLSLSEAVPMPEETDLLSFNGFDPRFSFLLSLLGRLALGSQFTTGMAIDLHPMAIAGFIALMLGGLQLLPVGQLDGGHMVHAMFGQRTAAIVAQITRLCMIALAFVEPNFLFLAVFAILIPIGDQPALNDVSELDNRRDLLGMLTLIFVITIFLPVPGTVASWLNF